MTREHVYGYTASMDESSPGRQPAVPPPPALPDVDSPPTEEVLDSLPSREDVVDEARSVAEIVREQPSVDAILASDRK
jgi:hypothetical protein